MSRAAGSAASRSMIGIASSSRLSIAATRRSIESAGSSRYRRSSSFRSPRSRVRHRSAPPITAASTSSRSHIAGAFPSERYSANRDALSPSSAQCSSARKLRPDASGRADPCVQCAGIPARRSASITSG